MEDFGFKFKIGQFVQHVGKLTHAKKGRDFGWAIGAAPVRFLVVERVLQECPGGIQRHYTCRAVFADGHIKDSLFQMNEVELIEEAVAAEESAE